MKRYLLLIGLISFSSFGQIDYTIDVLRLKAKADPCDGGAPFCLSAPQDPVYNIWTNDQEANENTYCWVFEDDPEAEYNLWKDIQNVQIANESNVMTSYLNFEMSGFESDAIGSPNCTSGLGDDEVYDRQFVQQIDIATIPEGTPTLYTLDLAGIYFAEIEITWIDLTAGLTELEKDLLFTISPNPSNGSFKLRFSNSEISIANVEIKDMSGRSVYQNEINVQQESIDLSNQDSGMYFVTIAINGYSSTETLIIK
jgi:hypothetical protein